MLRFVDHTQTHTLEFLLTRDQPVEEAPNKQQIQETSICVFRRFEHAIPVIKSRQMYASGLTTTWIGILILLLPRKKKFAFK